MAGKIESPDFAQRLGEAITVWAEHHPAPDEPKVNFMGSEGKKSFTPRQYAQEIVSQTVFGKDQTITYLHISRNLGDETGERIINDFLDWESWWK